MTAYSEDQRNHRPAGTSPAPRYQQYRSPEQWPDAGALGLTDQDDPRLALWVPGSYASLWDLQTLSMADDTRCDYPEATLRGWLALGASKINEHLANRGWEVPLRMWSATVVHCNTELAYCGATIRRGVNMEGSQLANLRWRYDNMEKWLQRAQEREITPDVRLSVAAQPKTAMRFIGASAPRGWEGPCGGGGWGRR